MPPANHSDRQREQTKIQIWIQKRRLLIITTISIALITAGILAQNAQQLKAPIPVAIGIDMPLTAGGAIDPSDKNAADLYRQEHPDSRIEIHKSFNSVDPKGGPSDLKQSMDQGIQFFINTQASNNAVESIKVFDSNKALSINVSATSTKLSQRDDYFLRVIPDLAHEQTAIAELWARLPGRRMLVLQDTGNTAYTDKALSVFKRELNRRNQWQLVVVRLPFATYRPKQLDGVLEQPLDGLYVLGGGFVPSIGNMTQQFHQHHPQAPIVLTPWARSAIVLSHAGDAANQIYQVSPYRSAEQDPAIQQYMDRFQRRFGYEPHAMSIGTRQALELLEQAFAKGHRTPESVKRYLLSQPVHQTSLGAIRFNRFGDSNSDLHIYRPVPPAQSTKA